MSAPESSRSLLFLVSLRCSSVPLLKLTLASCCPGVSDRLPSSAGWGEFQTPHFYAFGTSERVPGSQNQIFLSLGTPGHLQTNKKRHKTFSKQIVLQIYKFWQMFSNLLRSPKTYQIFSNPFRSSSIFQDFLNDFEIFENVPGSAQMLYKLRKCSQILSTTFRSSKMFSDLVNILSDLQTNSQMFSNILKYSKIFLNMLNYYNIFINILKYFQIFANLLKFYQVFPNIFKY